MVGFARHDLLLFRETLSKTVSLPLKSPKGLLSYKGKKWAGLESNQLHSRSAPDALPVRYCYRTSPRRANELPAQKSASGWICTSDLQGLTLDALVSIGAETPINLSLLNAVPYGATGSMFSNFKDQLQCKFCTA